MIHVEVIETGDNAEAETPEDAVCAALTMGQDARDHARLWGFDPSIRFSVDGEPVRVYTLRDLTR